MVSFALLPEHDDLFCPAPPTTTLIPWKPEALRHDQWPPDYRAVFAWRIRTLLQLRGNPDQIANAKAYYKTRPLEFIMHWLDTYDPRQAETKWMPFVFFWRQREFIEFLHELRTDSENGLVEKCRDAGATWLACAYSVWSFLFIDGDSIGWGSRKQDLVDTIGDPDSIFEKMRLLLRRMPDVFLPAGWKWRDHATFEKFINPENGATITGEAGDKIGRGGRKSMYFKDESAHYERPEQIESALGDNTNVQVDISSVNGLGNVFHRRRESGVDWSPGRRIDSGFTRVFVIDWSDHPAKTQLWYDRRKAKAVREGLEHVFAQEVDRNYSAAVQNILIPYEWVQSAVDAHLEIPYFAIAAQAAPNAWAGGLDVADEGADRNALILRQWVVCRYADEWGARDPGVTARHAIDRCRQYRGMKLEFDSIGVGSNVKSEINRLVDEGVLDRTTIRFSPWNAGAAVIRPFEHIIPDDDESLVNKDFFGNFKAQAWWSVRSRFYKTFRARTEGVLYPVDDLISLDSRMPLLHQLKKELAQPTSIQNSGLRTIVDKKPNGTKSPNLADGLVMAYFPVPEETGPIVGGMRI